MQRVPGLSLAIVLASPFAVSVRSACAGLNDVARALGDMLPLHGRLVPGAELYGAIGKTPRAFAFTRASADTRSAGRPSLR